jgi:hypothetical protein
MPGPICSAGLFWTHSALDTLSGYSSVGSTGYAGDILRHLEWKFGVFHVFVYTGVVVPVIPRFHSISIKGR